MVAGSSIMLKPAGLCSVVLISRNSFIAVIAQPVLVELVVFITPPTLFEAGRTLPYTLRTVCFAS